MKVGIIDADLIGRKRHRFPNLACMKISSFHKSAGDSVELLTGYGNIPQYDKVYISKVFTDTQVPELFLGLENVEYGGTGFYFDKAPNLPASIEHTKPDYHLYDNYIAECIDAGASAKEFKEYTDYSIGFLTRGCFRKCGFCVNQKYDHVFAHSPLEEFYDSTRKKICLLDDNFFGCANWRNMLQELIATNKPFKFKQGLDERLLTDEKCELLFSAKYDGDITFAFDDIDDYELIKTKLDMIRRHSKRDNIKFYVLCGYKSTDLRDIVDTFERIKLLAGYNTRPYIMRYMSSNEKPYETSEFRGIYITLARWCNQSNMFKKMSFWEYGATSGGSAERYVSEFAEKYPQIAKRYFHFKYGGAENDKT